MPSTILLGAARKPVIREATLDSGMRPGVAIRLRHPIAFEQATSAATATHLLDYRQWFGTNYFGSSAINDPTADAYQSGDTGRGILLQPGLRVQWRVAAGTYTVGHAMTVNSAGRLQAATTGQTVVAVMLESGASLDGDLRAAEACIRYTKP